MKIDTDKKNKRIQFREAYDKLTSDKEKKAFIQELGYDFTTILESGYLFLDERDGQIYDCMFVDNTRWMAQNFSFNKKNKSNSTKYKWSEIQNLIPKGWRMPTFDDYYNLIFKAEAIVAKELGVENHEIESNCYEVYEMLQRDKVLEFNSGYAVYGYPDNYLPFWVDTKKFFYLYDGQNEFSYGIESIKIEGDEEAFVRFVQDESTLK